MPNSAPYAGPLGDRRMIKRLATPTILAALLVLWACDPSSSSDTKCATGSDRVGMGTFSSTIIDPGKTLEVSSFEPACNGQCPVTGQAWTATPRASATGTLTVTYGAHCGPSPSGSFSSDTIGTCKLSFAGSTALSDASLADSHSADCVALWAGVNPDNPADTKPCSAGSTNNFMPYITFVNNGTVAVTITGPGPATNPTANCTYAPTK